MTFPFRLNGIRPFRLPFSSRFAGGANGNHGKRKREREREREMEKVVR